MTELEKVLATHRIDLGLLTSDDFKGFLRHRASMLLDAVGEMMGKPVQGREAEEVTQAFGGPLGLEGPSKISSSLESPKIP